MAWYVYMLRCGDGSLYTGSTTDVARRLREHQNGTGAKYTRARPPVSLAYTKRRIPARSAARHPPRRPLRRPAPGGGYQKAAPETEIGADRRRYTMNLKKRLVLGENGSSAGKLLGRITGIGPGRYNRCGGSVQALCHEAGRMTVL